MADSGFYITMDEKSKKRLMDIFANIDKKLSLSQQSKLWEIMEISAQEAATEAKQICPVVTGRLKTSIHVKSKPSDSFSFTILGETFDGGLKTPVQPGRNLLIGTNVEYAFKVHAKNNFLLRGWINTSSSFERKVQKLVNNAIKGR